jgi:hypothetical protein
VPVVARIVDVCARYGASSDTLAGGYSDAGTRPAIEAPNKRGEKLIGIRKDERDQAARAASPRRAVPPRSAASLEEDRIRNERLGRGVDEPDAGIGPRRLLERVDQRARRRHQTWGRASTSAATRATTCATVRMVGTLVHRNGNVEAVFELGHGLEHLQGIETEIGNQVAAERTARSAGG